MITVNLMEPRKRFQLKSYGHGMDLKYAVLEIFRNCAIPKNNQDIIMGVRYSFSKDYSNEAIKVPTSNISETL